MKKIGVLLAGCGNLDGAEIRESVFTLLALDKLQDENHFEVEIFAPNKNQHKVMDHFRREEVHETRNVLVEAARIARGQIKDLAQINPADLSALVMPGGFGAALNFSDFPYKGSEAELDPAILGLIKHMHEHKKPIAAICISPALLALALGKHHITVTLGADNDTIAEVEATGAHHQDKGPAEICVDEKNLIVTTPAYMHGKARSYEIAEGIEKCCRRLVSLLKKQ
jgi:enhancing lycopene biosynthesis protein 2